ncbi:MAG: molecular chaperone HtpG [Gammaproteobacteria bacterium]|nr:molecular chaperone HtpG [Gammaproteobacteria bacterium]
MAVQSQQETMPFQAEVKQLLYLVTHSLYSNKEIFLRELISNASDAADKLRFEALTDAQLYENGPDLKIWIDIDKEARTITIRDNGIGMTREEVVQNLGTIAKSGTREFLEKLTASQSKDAHLIGQFGVGFYSSFVVADKVVVKTRRAGMTPEQGVYWESEGQGQFIIENINKESRGTEVVLHLKKEDDEFLDEWRIKNIITKYSDHILLPIVMKEPKLEEVAAEEEGKEPVLEEVTVNKATALWTLPKSQITDEEYNTLYKHIAHDFEDPLVWSHNKVEGKLEYTSLLYIPARAPFDIWNRDHYKGLKLYVRRVFIMDDAEQLLPSYLRFVRGIVDSNDLPLNVSREILQNNHVIDSIRTASTRRVLDMLEKLSIDDNDKYKKFLSAFGQVLKEGPAEDHTNKERIAKLFRFSTTRDDNADPSVSLDEYIKNMKEDQDKIYYVIADTFNAAKNSPHLEIFRKNGVEVLLLSDKIDEWWVAHMDEYAGKKFQSVAKGDLNITKQDEEVNKELEEKYQDVVKRIKDVLEDKVKEVRVTNRLTDSPACLVTDDNEMSAHLQRMLSASGQSFPGSKPILEINPTHPIINYLNQASDDELKNWSQILFDQALLAEGGQLEDPGSFVKNINSLLVKQVMK